MASRPRRSAVVLGISVAFAAACGGAIDNGELFENDGKGSSSGTSGATPTPTATGTAAPEPAQPPNRPVKPCAVSFKKDVMRLFEEYGCTAVTCHGGNLLLPRIDPKNTTGTYQGLTTFKAAGGKPYVAAGSTNPKDSGIYCNVRGDCGTRMPPGDKVESNDLDTIDTWLECGAPQN